MFKDKTLMITGGTGSFGNAVLKRFLDTDIKEIRIFSRDEKKQDDMRHEYQAKYPEVAHRRCSLVTKLSKCYARSGLYLPRSSIETSSFVRVFPYGGSKN